MTKMIVRLIAAAVVALALRAPHLGAQDVKVIVHPANGVSELPAAEITSLFLKKSTKFSDGTTAVPVDQAKGSPFRAAFARQVLGRPVAAVETYWQQQIFGGGELPPVIKAGDDEVVAFVKATPGAIAYVSASASTAGVKVIAVR